MRFFSLKKIYLFVNIQIFVIIGHGQTYFGLLTTNDNQLITYKLVIYPKVDGHFTGYSITNFEGKDYTKSTIEGEIDSKNKTFSFKETTNAETKSKADASTFCYINATKLAISTIKNNTVLKGVFVGKYSNQKTCASGNIYMVEKTMDSDTKNKSRKPKERLNKKEKSKSVLVDTSISAETDTIVKKLIDTLTTSNDIVDTIAPKNLADSTVLTANKEMLIKNWNNGLTLEVWDGNILDYDEISIYLNEEIIVDKLVLSRTKSVFILPADSMNFNLKIKALNEGNSWKNTLNFRIINSENTREYTAVLNKEESFNIKFSKE